MFAKLFQILMTPADSPKNKTREIPHRKWTQPKSEIKLITSKLLLIIWLFASLCCPNLGWIISLRGSGVCLH